MAFDEGTAEVAFESAFSAGAEGAGVDVELAGGSDGAGAHAAQKMRLNNSTNG